MLLSKKYQWITTIGPLPKMIISGLNLLGIKEYPGKSTNNPLIMNMAKELGVEGIYTSDEVEWCALAHCYVCKISGKPMPFTGYEILRANSFRQWGNFVPPKSEVFGDTLIFQRPKGFHVGLYIAESKTSFHVIGGNQSNSYSFTEILKGRLVEARRYYAIAPPASAKKYFMDSSGLVSTNEQ